MEKRAVWEKIKRILTAALPIAKKRRGACKRCGQCCQLAFRCPFLRFDKEGKSRCLVYPVRFLGCRKYPRTEKQQVTNEGCGFWFEKDLKE